MNSILRGWRVRSGAKKVLVQCTIPSPTNQHWFVGYYDHSPFKPDDESLLLVHATIHPPWRKPSPRIPVDILLVNWKSGAVVQDIGRSFSWNWQQGARALWVDSRTVIFNMYDQNMDVYRACMVDIVTRERKLLPLAIQEVDANGKVYGFSYEALACVRPDYGYRNRTIDIAALKKNAIQQYDSDSGQLRSLVKVETLCEAAARRHGSEVVKPKFNHLMASPDARKLIFLFRYYIRGRRITDCFLLALDDSEPRLLVPDCGVSHACWWGNDSIMATMAGSDGFGYCRIDIAGGIPELVWRQRDGHPNCLGASHMLTDTYPDHQGLRHLQIRSLDAGATNEIAAFPEPLLLQGETRCDLHPSQSPSGRWIQVDCMVGHRRAVAVLQNPLFSG